MTVKNEVMISNIYCQIFRQYWSEHELDLLVLVLFLNHQFFLVPQLLIQVRPDMR